MLSGIEVSFLRVLWYILSLVQLYIYFCYFNSCLDWIGIFAKGSLIIFWSETMMIYHITCLIRVEAKCCVCRQRGNYWNALRQANNGDGCFLFLQVSWQSIVHNRDFNAGRVAMPVLKKSSLKCWEKQEGSCLQTAWWKQSTLWVNWGRPVERDQLRWGC